jgi:hypothetical protein
MKESVKNSFNEFIMKYPGNNDYLPLCHTCESFNFRGIIFEKILNTTPCQKFQGENLLYLFYGKPSYRVNKTEPSKLNFFYPICIVIEPRIQNQIKRIYPFDSGAFDGFYKSHLHPKMKINDFILDPDINSISKIISLFYKTNDNYINCRPQKINVPPLEFEIQAYYSIINDISSSKADDRNSTIEVQYNTSLELTSDIVKLIIIPTLFFEDEEIIKTLTKNWPRSQISQYDTFRGTPNEYHGIIFSIVKSFLIQNKYLNDRNIEEQV